MAEVPERQIETGPGNINGPLKTPKQGVQRVYWFFTYNNYVPETIVTLEQVLKHECKWFIFQEEIAPTTGTPHLQGTICLKVKQRNTALEAIDPKIWWKPTISVKGSAAYCSLIAKRKPGGICVVYGIEVPRPIELDEPRGWQLEVLEIISQKPDKRTIHWFWEPDGGVGKSELAMWLYHRRNAFVGRGKAADVFYLMSKTSERREVFVLDYPKHQVEFINYGMLEEMKNGFVFSGKYESGVITFPRPHVFVFANVPPETERMSKGRFHVVRIQAEAPLTPP